MTYDLGMSGVPSDGDLLTPNYIVICEERGWARFVSVKMSDDSDIPGTEVWFWIDIYHCRYWHRYKLSESRDKLIYYGKCSVINPLLKTKAPGPVINNMQAVLNTVNEIITRAIDG